MTRHNLRTVVGFEFLRVVTKKWFWLAVLAIPLGMAAVFVVVIASGETTDRAAQAQSEARFTFTFTDESGLISDEVAVGYGGVRVRADPDAVGDVRAGAVDAHFTFPADPSTQPVKVYGADRGLFENGKYSAVARQMLLDGVGRAIGSPELSALAGGQVSIDTQTFTDGEPAAGISGVVPPLLFLALFYVTIILLGNQMLNSTLEEKENRVTEMILTTMDPTTLLIGKVISLFMIGLVQMLAFATPVVVGYAFFRDRLDMPDVDLSQLSIDPRTMTVGFLLFVGGFGLFTSTLVAIGAVVPTVKEAGNYFAPLVIMIFVPFYVVGLVVSDPSAPIVQIFTYFPYTAPATAMLRNGFDSLSLVEAGVVVVELFVLSYLMLRVAVQLFRYGSISYSKRLPIRSVLGMRPHPRRAVTERPGS